MSRASDIQARLDDHFCNVVGVSVSTPDPDLWTSLIAGLGPHAQFGWSHPISNDEPDMPAVIVPYCPAIIAEQTAGLTDDELDQYLMVVEWVCDAHIIHWNDIPDVDDRHRQIEADLYDRYPASLDVWNSVQLAALDAQA